MQLDSSRALNRVGSAMAWAPRTPLHWLLLNLVAMLSIMAAARLGALLSVGQPSASVLWPPNGLALALLMAWGWRLLPGLVTGVLLPSLWMAWQQGMDPLNGYLIPVAVRLGSALQWGLALHTLGDWRSALLRPGSRFAMRFAAVVLLACVVAPTVGLLVLHLAGRVSAQALPLAWLTWWVGDVAGMLVLTPLLLAALHPAMRQHVMGNQAFLTLTLGAGLTLAGCALLGHLDTQARRERARAEVNAFAQALRSQMALAEADLGQLAALLAHAQVPPEEFEQQATALRTQHDWVSGFASLRALPHAERVAFEDSIGQSIRAVGADGLLVKAPMQQRYWVVERLSPVGGQEARLGVDEFSDAERRRAIETAIHTRQTGSTRLLDDPSFAADTEWSVLMYRPVIELPLDGRRERAVTGMVQATLKLETLLSAAQRNARTLQFPTLLRTGPGASARAMLLADGKAEALPGDAAQRWIAGFVAHDLNEVPLRFANDDWSLHNSASTAGWWRAPSASQWTAAAMGLGCTTLLTALLMMRARRDQVLTRWSEELREQVELRTAELQHQTRQLGEREALLSSLLRAIPDPVWMKGLDGRYLLVNAAFERFLGRSAPELIGRSSAEVMNAAESAVVVEADRQIQGGDRAVETEVSLTDAAGRSRLLQQTRVQVRDEGGRPLGLLGLSWDITEQRQREQALQRFRWLADSAAQGFVLSDVAGKVVYLNASAQGWLGETDWHDDGGTEARRYYDDASWSRLNDEVLPAVLANGSWTGMLPLRSRDDALLAQLLSSYFVLRDADQQPRYVALLLTDLSERLRLEEDLAQARDQAEEANRAKSVFLSNISHEIRTPLNAVLGYAQLLAEDESLPAHAHAQVLNVHSAGTRLLRLINDVLDLSKIEAGALQIVPEPVEVHAELAEVLQLMKGRADQQQLQLSLQRDFEAPLVALLDRGKFGQVLINLLANAIKFTPPGGRVLLQATLEDGSVLHAVVEDDGPGVSPAELAALFRPFQQGASGLQQGGTGLGLSLSRKIAEALGGRLWLDSEPGRGTRAHLLLPLQLSPSAQPAAAVDRFADGAWRLAPDSRCRVLVVEDDRDSREVLAGYLRQLGCEIGVAADGVQALALAQERDFDIVLTDMRMPELDGPGLREALAAIERCAAWPVVAVTASSLLLQREHFLQQGFAEYVAKPYAFADILRTLQRLGGARFERRSERAGPSHGDLPPSPLEAPPDVVGLQQALAWAQEGRASELRAWMSAPAALPTALRAPLTAALARYDLQLVERLLQDHLNALEPR